LFCYKEGDDATPLPSSLLCYKEGDDTMPPSSSLFCCEEGDDKRHLFLSGVIFFSLFEEGVTCLFFGMLSWVPNGAPFKGRTTRFFAFGLLKKEKNPIWLFTNVFVWICRIAMGRERKLKKVCCDQEVQ